ISLTTGAVTVEVNTTSSQVTTIGTTTLATPLPAGPYFKVEVANTDLVVLSSTLHADNFVFEKQGSTVTVNVTNVNLKLAVGTTVLVQATGGNINLLFNDAGVVADVSLTSLSIPSIPNVSLTAGPARVLINTT